MSFIEVLQLFETHNTGFTRRKTQSKSIQYLRTEDETCQLFIQDIDVFQIKLFQPGLFRRNVLDVIGGYESAELCSIDQALADFNDEFKEQIIEARKQYQSRTVEQTNSLSTDEWLAIYLFSMTEANLLRAKFNEDLSEQNSRIERWFKYLRLLKSGLTKVKLEKTNVVQIVDADSSLANILSPESVEWFTGIFSSPGSIEEIDCSIIAPQDKCPPIVIEYIDVMAFDVYNITNNPRVRYLIWAGRKMVRKRPPDTNSPTGTADEFDITLSIYPELKIICEKTSDNLLVVRLSAVYGNQKLSSFQTKFTVFSRFYSFTILCTFKILVIRIELKIFSDRKSLSIEIISFLIFK